MNTIKKSLAVSLLIFASLNVFADEGMWLPILLKQLNEADMQRKGLKLSADDIFSLNKSSLKDAVVLFGGGCTAEVISDKGLLLTNHHCGFSTVASVSTVENDYLKNGFWAYKIEDEKPAPGLTVTFIIGIEDVTAKIIPMLNDNMSEQERNKKIREVASKLEREAVAGTHYDASVKPFYNGNEFYLFTTETFKDIRLVGAPPSAVGNYGGETDNWVWPRHTGDFSMFRIYANKENKPAEYSKDNVPFKPRYHFPVSLAGVQEGDFTMVYGFPGRTTEYLSSYAVDLTQNISDPNSVAIREARIKIMDDAMHGNDTIRLMYSPKARSLANAYKKWKGEMIGLKKNDAVGKKQKFETDFRTWTTTTTEGKKYATLLDDLKSTYDQYRPLAKTVDFTNEAAYGIELINYATNFDKLVTLCKSDTVADSTIANEAQRLLKNSTGFFKNYRVAIDKQVFAKLMKMYSDSVAQTYQPDYLEQQVLKYNGDFNKYADMVFEKSFMTSIEKTEAVLKNLKRKSLKKIQNDPVYALMDAISTTYDDVVVEKVSKINESITKLNRTYMQAQREFQKDKVFYPDANSTLRVAYGNVKGYYPRNGVYYTAQTTLGGAIEKYIPNDDEFDLPKKLTELYAQKDFGRYGVNGDVPIAFIATNHTTGGNSGSPVLNAKGELIGTNFDRVWEGTMSDIMFDPDRCRNITLDVPYTLFIIDKYAGAKNLIDEMEIVK
ncbi:MAG: S46 family peptidase [Bacteroidia bacterium]